VITNPFRFLEIASSGERRVLLASSLGWMLDGMDVTLYAMVIGELLRELRISTAEAGLLASITLIASGIGGVLFGILADHAGRRFAMMLSIAVYSVFTGACGFSHGIPELIFFRFLVGLGMGGEWATGAALVSETWPPQHRGKALGLMQSGFAVGYALAALVAALVLPHWGWRSVFFVGVAPALLTLWIRSGVNESPLWLAKKIAGPGDSSAPSRAASSHSPFHITARRHVRMILLTLLMNSAALFAWWGLFTWIPSYLARPVALGGRGLSVAASAEWIIAMQVGMWLGYVTFGFISDTMGRKKTYMAYLFLAAALVPLYARIHAASSLLLIGPLLAFFGTGHFTGFGIITSELFPTSFRASAMGLTYNGGRALSAAAPWAIGALAGSRGLGSAFWICAVAFLVAAVFAMGIPETRGRPLA
jgi:MFS family permease